MTWIVPLSPSHAIHMRPVESRSNDAALTPDGSVIIDVGGVVTVYVPSPPAWNWSVATESVAGSAAGVLNISTCVTLPTAFTSALTARSLEIFTAGVQVAPSRRKTHVPSACERTVHHVLLCFQTLDCGLSDVSVATETGLRLVT